jgi:hypothetical protein
MDDVGDGIPRSSHWKTKFSHFFNDGLDLGFVRCHEFNVIPAGESEVAITILIGNITNVPDKIDTDQARRSHPYRKDLISGLRDVAKHSWLQDLVILPSSVIFLYDLREHLLKIRRTNI